MATGYGTSARIAAPAAVVWEVLTDLEHMPEWTTSMTSVRYLEGHRCAAGSKLEIRQPRMPVLTWTVDDVVPLQHFRWSTSSPGVITTGDHWLTPCADGREVDVRFEIRHTGPLAGLVGALTMRRTARYVDLELRGLQSASEAAVAADRSDQ